MDFQTGKYTSTCQLLEQEMLPEKIVHRTVKELPGPETPMDMEQKFGWSYLLQSVAHLCVSEVMRLVCCPWRLDTEDEKEEPAAEI